jgi:hypothetical protein
VSGEGVADGLHGRDGVEPDGDQVGVDAAIGRSRLESGSVVNLGDLIATTPGTVFWSVTEPIIGSGCCLVTRDIESDVGCTLRRGRYVHHSVLSSGEQVPPLDVLLTETRTTDLAPRF